MLKQVSVLLVLISVMIAFEACGPAATSAVAPQNAQTPSPISTEKIFALTKLGGLTAEVETQAALSPKNSATVEAILATKQAGAKQAFETMTAMPTETFTPTIPSASPFCTSADLKISYDVTGATGNILMTAVLTNISNTPCYLQTPPQVIFLDGPHGKPLDVDYNYSPDSANTFPNDKVGLLPGWRAGVTLIWFDYHTWCGAPITNNLVIQITLSNDLGRLDMLTDFRPGTACDVPGTRTSVGIWNLKLISPPISTETPMP